MTKKPYRTPTVRVYGTIEQITQTKDFGKVTDGTKFGKTGV